MRPETVASKLDRLNRAAGQDRVHITTGFESGNSGGDVDGRQWPIFPYCHQVQICWAQRLVLACKQYDVLPDRFPLGTTREYYRDSQTRARSYSWYPKKRDSRTRLDESVWSRGYGSDIYVSQFVDTMRE